MNTAKSVLHIPEPDTVEAEEERLRRRAEQREQERIRKEYAQNNTHDKWGNPVGIMQAGDSGLTPAKPKAQSFGRQARPRSLVPQTPPRQQGDGRSSPFDTAEKEFLRKKWARENARHRNATRIQAVYRGRATRKQQLISKLREAREVIDAIIEEEEQQQDMREVLDVLNTQTPKKRGRSLEYKPTLKF